MPMDPLQALDAHLSQKLVLPPDSDWRQVARITAHLGDGPYVFTGLGLVYLAGVLLKEAYLYRAIIVITVSVLIGMAVVTIIKFIVRRERPLPPGEFVTFKYDAYSFPSGHAARLAVLGVSTIYFFPRLGGALMLLALGVALARVGVGVHYLGDILAGLGLGMITAAAITGLIIYLFPIVIG